MKIYPVIFFTNFSIFAYLMKKTVTGEADCRIIFHSAAANSFLNSAISSGRINSISIPTVEDLVPQQTRILPE